MEVKCETCGKLFEKSKGRLSRTRTGKHYCSQVCYRENPIITQEKTGREIECDFCGSIVYKSWAQLERSKTGNHFCSKQCSQSFISKQVRSNHNVVCDNCSKPFRKSPSTIGERNYCSRECWKEGVRSFGPTFYRKFKKETCERCGFIPEDLCQLDVHHADLDTENNSSDNLKTFCANCHRLVHKEVRDYEL